MFLVAVARTRYDSDNDLAFDGKIDLWTFIERITTKQNSKNRVKGTIKSKTITVDGKVYKQKLI